MTGLGRAQPTWRPDVFLLARHAWRVDVVHAGTDAVGNFDFTRDRIALFRDRPTNVFQIKMNYWFGR